LEERESRERTRERGGLEYWMEGGNVTGGEKLGFSEIIYSVRVLVSGGLKLVGPLDLRSIGLGLGVMLTFAFGKAHSLGLNSFFFF